jgi:prolyl-tRNA synthetase
LLDEKKGLFQAFWCGDQHCEEEIKNDTKATIRCIPFGKEDEKGPCLYCGREGGKMVYLARSY